MTGIFPDCIRSLKITQTRTNRNGSVQVFKIASTSLSIYIFSIQRTGAMTSTETKSRYASSKQLSGDSTVNERSRSILPSNPRTTTTSSFDSSNDLFSSKKWLTRNVQSGTPGNPDLCMNQPLPPTVNYGLCQDCGRIVKFLWWTKRCSFCGGPLQK